MAELIIAVRGLPAPQGSKRHVGNGVMLESSKHVGPWRDAVAAAALQYRQARRGIAWPIDGPVKAVMDFYFARPRKHYRTGRMADILRDDAPEYHTQYPDASKLIRATEDALTTAGIWADDARAVIVTGWKHWAGGEQLPGAVIRLTPLGEAMLP